MNQNQPPPNPQSIYPDPQENNPKQIPPKSEINQLGKKEKSFSCLRVIEFFIWVIWIISTVLFIYGLYMIGCEVFKNSGSDAMACGSDSAGIPSAIGLVLIGIWIVVSIILFIVHRVNKK